MDCGVLICWKISTPKLSKKLSGEVLTKALSLYQLNPLNKTLLNDLALLYGYSGDHEKRDFHLLQYQLLVETIGKGGTGLLEETPIVVTSFHDKFLASIFRTSDLLVHEP